MPSYAPQQVRDRLIVVDGEGSKHADRLDGFDSSEFVRTVEQILALLRTADGAGSGFDATGWMALTHRFIRTAEDVLRLLRTADEPTGIGC